MEITVAQVRQAAEDTFEMGDPTRLAELARIRPDLVAPYHLRLVDAGLCWVSELYRGMSAATATELVRRVDDAEGDPSALINALVAGGTETAVAAVRRWAADPPSWSGKLYPALSVTGHAGGWELGPSGHRRALTSRHAFALSPDPAWSPPAPVPSRWAGLPGVPPGAATVVPPLTAGPVPPGGAVAGGVLPTECGWCGLALWRLLDADRTLLPDLLAADESRSEQSRSGEGRSEEGRSGEGRSGEGRSGEGRSGESRSGESPSEEGRSEESRSDQSRSDKSRSDQSRSEEGRSEEGRSGEGRSEESRSDQGRAGEGWAGTGRWGGSRFTVATCLRCDGYATVFTKAGRFAAENATAPDPVARGLIEHFDLPTGPPLTVGRPRPTAFAASAWNSGGSTLGGTPDWIQDPAYPSCPRCATTMPFVGMIVGEDLWPDVAEGCHYLFHDPVCGLSAAVHQQS